MKGTRSHPPAADLAASLARTLAGLRDPSVQIGWVRDQLTRLGAARAADVLTVVLARAHEREDPYSVLLLRVSLALSGDDEMTLLKQAIAQWADVRGQYSLALFLGGGVIPEARDQHAAQAQAPAEGEAVSPEEGGRAAQRTTHTGGRPLSLGERKSIARKRDRNLLARVLRDPHPEVIKILLTNPALIEDDVVRLCARRPVAPEVLAQVFQAPRWVLRYRIRLTLALNPHTPEEITLQLLPHLSPGDLREVARSSQLSERIRAACVEARRSTLH